MGRSRNSSMPDMRSSSSIACTRGRERAQHVDVKQSRVCMCTYIAGYEGTKRWGLIGAAALRGISQPGALDECVMSIVGDARGIYRLALAPLSPSISMVTESEPHPQVGHHELQLRTKRCWNWLHKIPLCQLYNCSHTPGSVAKRTSANAGLSTAMSTVFSTPITAFRSPDSAGTSWQLGRGGVVHVFSPPLMPNANPDERTKGLCV
jgi:hypothetical protein